MSKMKIIVLSLTAFALMFSFGCRSKTVVKKLKPAQANVPEGRKVKVEKDETDKLEGVIYRLPRTVVQVEIPVKKVTKSPGEFSKFAPCFFSPQDLENWIKQESVSFSIGSPTFLSRGEPDAEAGTFVVKTKGRFFESKSLFMEYSSDYVLQSAKAESKDESLEFGLKAAKTIIGIAAKTATVLGANGEEIDPSKDFTKADCIKRMDEYQKFIDQKIEKVNKEKNERNQNLRAATTDSEKQRIKTKLEALNKTIEGLNKEKQTVSDYQEELQKLIKAEADRITAEADRKKAEAEKKKAENNRVASKKRSPDKTTAADTTTAANPGENVEAANKQKPADEFETARQTFNQLLILKDNRENLISKPATNNPPETFKQQLAETDKAIEAYQNAFLGYKNTEVWKRSFEVAPKSKLPYQISPLIFSYLPARGICRDGLVEKNSITIDPGFEYADCNLEPKRIAVWLRIQRDAGDAGFHSNVDVATDKSAKADKSRGWYYRIPAKAVVMLKTGEMPDGAIAGFNSLAEALNTQIAGIMNQPLSNAQITQMVNGFEAQASRLRQIARDERQIAQLGVIASIPASTAGRSSTTEIQLDPATGALKNFKLSSNPLLDKAMLEDVNAAAGSVLDAADPVNKKKRELELLQLQNKINTERKNLNNPSTTTTDNNDNDNNH